MQQSKKDFKLLSTDVFQQAGIESIEDWLKTRVGSVLKRITDKINETMVSGEQVEPTITFNWSNVISKWS